MFVVWIMVFEFPPWQHVGKTQQDDISEEIRGAAAVEADSETAATAVEVGRGYVIIISAGVHF